VKRLNTYQKSILYTKNIFELAFKMLIAKLLTKFLISTVKVPKPDIKS